MSIIDEATNMFGQLPEYTKGLLSDVLRNPTQDTWEAAYSVVVNGDNLMTMWRAVQIADPEFQHSRGFAREWDYVPSQLTIARAIKLAATWDPEEEY